MDKDGQDFEVRQTAYPHFYETSKNPPPSPTHTQKREWSQVSDGRYWRKSQLDINAIIINVPDLPR